MGKLEGPSAALPYFERALPLLEQKMGKDKPFYVQVENNYAYQLVQAHACDKALPHLDHAIAASAKRPDLASMPVLLSGMCQESAGHPDLALARYVQVGEMCAKATCEPTITIQARFKEGALRYARGNRPQGLALVREARRAYDEKHMATDAKEVDAWFAAHHEKAAD